MPLSATGTPTGAFRATHLLFGPHDPGDVPA
ncbi:hypothetical protein STAFG_6459 [Streptomyces afghaniensis 772]|uniref:Uncharacterized protein n=1 Tax=Streptomyces afghaniensis 772 TaxID=1283301 RepID=S4MS67_9ACTN|nr:hypothetical protein STAFG_6459 [Streptomyces afghaniensis 772]